MTVFGAVTGDRSNKSMKKMNRHPMRRLAWKLKQPKLKIS